jgi:L-ascorbate metabolism protein UlaG (beta-lactamase superfamily)
LKRNRSLVAACVAALVLAGCTGRLPDATQPAPESVSLTWLSVTSWLLEAGDTRILFDGYVSRVDRTTVEADGSSTATAPLDTAAVRRVRDAVPGARDLDWILVGHGHWDHAFDAPAWARLTGARVVGARTVCYQVVAFEPSSPCTAVEGGEAFEAGPGVRVRVVRWHHSGDSLTADGRRLRAPLELRAPPAPDPATGGLRPGFIEDYPNGGGSRAYLVTVETRTGALTLFWSNTGNPQAWDRPIPADTALIREEGVEIAHLEWATSDLSTREHLGRAMADAALDSVDLWIGFGGAEHVGQVARTLRPLAFAPHHWDDFWTPLVAGPGRTFPASSILPLLEQAGIRLVVPAQYFDRLILTSDSVRLEDGDAVRQVLGVSETPAG